MESVDVYYFSIKLLLLLLLFRMVRFDAYDYSLSNYFSLIFLHHHCYIYQLYFFLSPLSNFCNTIGTFTIFFFFYLLSHFRSQAGNKLGSNCGSGDAKFTVSLLSPIFFPKKFGNPITKFWLSPHSANKLRPMHVSLVNFHLCNIYPKYSNRSDTQHKKSSIVKIMLYAVFYAHYIIVTWKCDFKLRF